MQTYFKWMVKQRN